MEELRLLQKTGTPAPVFIVQFQADRIGEYQGMARTLRARGIGVEVFPDAKKMGPQFQYAEKRGFQRRPDRRPGRIRPGTSGK